MKINKIKKAFSLIELSIVAVIVAILLAGLAQVRSMIYVLKRLNLIPETQFEELFELSDKTRRQTLGLIKYLNRRI